MRFSSFHPATTGVVGSAPSNIGTIASVTNAPVISLSTFIAKDGTVRSYLSGSWDAVAEATTYDIEINNGTTWTISSPIASIKNFEVEIKPSPLTYSIRVKGSNKNGLRSGSWSPASNSVVANGDVTPPGLVTGLSAFGSAGSREVTITWIDPTDLDYSHVKIYGGGTSSTFDPLTVLAFSAPKGGVYKYNHSKSVTTDLYYWVATVDYSGNESSPVFSYAVTIPQYNPGAGFDADLLDGYHASAFPRKDETASIISTWSFISNASVSASDYYGSSTWTQILSANSVSTQAGLALRSKASSGNFATGSLHVVPVAEYRSGLVATYSADGSGAGYFAVNQFVPTSSTTLERLRVNVDGNVGIGTTAPGAKLTVVKAGDYNSEGNVGIRILSADSSPSVGLHLGTDTTNNIGFIQAMHPVTDWTTRALVLQGNGGNVGIGLTNPTAKLDTLTTTGTTGTNTIVARFNKNSTNGAGSSILRLTSDGVSSDFETNSASSGGSFRFSSNYGDTNIANLINATNGPYGNINFVTNNAIRMTIGAGTQAGNVGIDTTTPTEKLHVNGRVMVTSSGYTANAVGGVLGYYSGAAVPQTYLQAPVGGEVVIWNASTAQMAVFKANNSVGIGTASPSFVGLGGNSLPILVVNGSTTSGGSSQSDTKLGQSTSLFDRNGWWGIRTGTDYSFNIDTYNNNTPISPFTVYQNGTIRNAGGIKTYSVSTPAQGNVNSRYELMRISRDPLNWSSNISYEITAYSKYYRSGGRTKWLVSYGHDSAGMISCIDARGTGKFRVYLGTEVSINANVAYIPVYVDIPEYNEITIEVKFSTNVVTSITDEQQVHFTGTMAVGTGALYSGNTHLVPDGGYLGINTTSPGTHLDVAGTIRSTTGVVSGANFIATSIGATPNIQFYRAGYQNWFLGSPDNSADFGLSEGSSSTYRMYFKSGGNVGIGTTSPTNKLHIFSSIANGVIEDSLLLDTNVGGGSSPSYYGAIRFRGNGYDWGAIRNIQTNPSASWASRMAFFTMNGAGGNIVERACIDNSGFFGVGVTNPWTTMDVTGSGVGGSGWSGRFGNVGNSIGLLLGYRGGIAAIGAQNALNLAIAPDGGYVGIGTTAPDGTLTVFNPATFNARTSGINVHRPSSYGQFGSMSYDGDTTFFASTYTGGGAGQGGAFRFLSYDNSSPVDRLTIARATGNVAIGSFTDPAYQLEVGKTTGGVIAISTDGQAGLTASPLITAINFLGYIDKVKAAITAEDREGNVLGGWLNFHTMDTGNVSQKRVTIDPNGFFGIGTATPQYRLDVNRGSVGIQASFGTGMGSSGEISGIHFGYAEAGNALYRKSALVFERSDAGIGDARGKIHLLNAITGSASATLADAKFTIDTAGNIGIGTTSPSQKLHVNGMTQTTALYNTEWNRSQTAYGYIDFGPANAGHGHIYTDRPTFYFNKELLVNGSTVWHAGNLSPVTLNTVQSISGRKTFSSSAGTIAGDFNANNYVNSALEVYNGDGNRAAYMSFHITGIAGIKFGLNTNAWLATDAVGMTINGNTTWHAGNDSGFVRDRGQSQISTSTSWDGFTTPGMYGVASGSAFTGTNNPGSVYTYGHLHVTGVLGQGIQQTYYSHTGDKTFFRTGWNSGGWQPWQQIWTSTSDGAGSGLDADLWDGNQFATYLNQAVRTDASPTFANVTATTFSGTATKTNHMNSTRDTPDSSLQYWQASGLGITEAPDGDWYNTIRMGHGSPLSYYSNTLAVRMTGSNVGDIFTQTIINGARQGWKKFWNDGNDGSGSGLDADLLKGKTIAESTVGDTIVSRNGGGRFSAAGIDFLGAQQGDLVNNSPWYGVGKSDITTFGGGGNVIQMAGYYGLRIRSPNSTMDFYQNGRIITSVPANKDFRVDGIINATRGIIDYSVDDNSSRPARILIPEGGARVGSAGSETGAIKIELPAAVYQANSMHTFTVCIYEYATGRTRRILCGGYNYSYWVYTSAIQQTESGGNINVRFGRQSSRDCVWIGETNTVWNYAQVWIEDVNCGYSGFTNAWATGWAVSLVTSFGTVENTHVAYAQWHGGNDGAGSGLDADLLDGYHASLGASGADSIPVRNGDGWLNQRVIRNVDGGSDGMYIGYGNSNSGLTRIYGGGSTSTHLSITTSSMTAPGEVYTPSGSYFRAVGTGGFYCETYNGGWNMTDGTWLRSIADKGILTGGAIQGATVTATSDLRLKSDLQPLANFSEVIDSTNVYSFIKDGIRQWGVIAQEVLNTPAALLVHEGGTVFHDGTPILTVDFAGFTYALLAEVKELRKRVALLEKK